jgi:hypothetical protein
VKPLRWLLHTLAGLLLYQMLVVLGGVLAAIGTPAGYFAFFGAAHKELALGVWSTATFAVPVALAADETSTPFWNTHVMPLWRVCASATTHNSPRPCVMPTFASRALPRVCS